MTPLRRRLFSTTRAVAARRKRAAGPGLQKATREQRGAALLLASRLHGPTPHPASVVPASRGRRFNGRRVPRHHRRVGATPGAVPPAAAGTPAGTRRGRR